MAKGSKGGAKGKSIAEVNTKFSKRLDELQENSRNQYAAFQGAEQRKWQIPTELTDDMLKVATLHEPAMVRDEINTQYEQVMKSRKSAGTIGDVISLKFQMDYMAAEERAFRVTHSSVCRSIAHAMGRRFGQGDGRLFPAIRDQAANMITAGGTS
jgi:hypothetical protein